MRILLAILLIASTTLVPAQDWTLLNPAYRYNYSNDGTDTISNQIRVMGVDTLGVDSIRYTLNLIGVVCDTCPASLGGPCDGCFVRVNQPQFLGYECIRYGDDWLFNGKDTFLVKTDAEINDSWSFIVTNAITATLVDEWETVVFGMTDTLKSIILSTGDSLLLSRSFGILSFHYSSESLGLIGVEGAGVGRRYPDVLNYFDYQVGDQLLYREGGVYQVSFPGGPSFIPYPISRFWQVIITGRSEIPDGILYSTSVAGTIPGQGSNGSVSGPFLSCTWQRPLSQWSFTRSQILAQHPILDAYPGQVLDTAVCWLNPGFHDYDTRVLAESGLTEDGKTIIRSRSIAPVNPFNPLITTSAFDIEDGVGLDLFPTLPIKVNQIYVEGLGLQVVEYNEWTNYIVDLELMGAIIDGDTIIPPANITWTVGMEEASLGALILYPNPADHTCFISGLIGSEQARVFDLEGRVVLTTQLAVERAAMDVSGLAPGTYVVNVKGMRPQRLIIAR